ncbi:MAG: TIGR04219 family outer membrane beta-barrel protein [Thiomicrospira sp.]|uniref:TIGR04219 family outer membrane beta-barrel protein n=1 Tax=Thiomicrospira sp. TaxID=935 RepID=UPI0019E8E1FF|nr:TIGR04219 family outer membrane beta-barrel protein [Thiomicrospira sp.]MBE0493820.1 TIGR04219 family outer membrane beta-barrel protein [Thiomicrospira sp.]
MKKYALAFTVLLISTQSQADVLGAGLGTGVWTSGPVGTVTTNNNEFDVKKDTGLSSSNNNYVWVYFNHPLPLIPNIRLESTRVSSSGSGSQNVTYLGNTYGNHETDLNLNQVDLLLYWGIPLPIVDINYGFGAKQFTGDLTITDTDGNIDPKTTDLDGTIPVGYLAAHANIPALPLSFSADIKTLGSLYNDTTIKGRYDITSFGLKLGIEAGYRSQKLKTDEVGDIDVDLKIDGYFAGVTLVF